MQDCYAGAPVPAAPGRGQASFSGTGLLPYLLPWPHKQIASAWMQGTAPWWPVGVVDVLRSVACTFVMKKATFLSIKEYN